ncbi:MAG: TonB-dependent receptor [Candidatus Brocadiia bacterium]
MKLSVLRLLASVTLFIFIIFSISQSFGDEQPKPNATSAPPAKDSDTGISEKELPESVIKAKAEGHATSSATITETPLLEIERFVETVDKQMLDDRDASSFYDSLAYVSGVFNGGNSPGTRTQGQVSLRGFSGSSILLNGAMLPKTMPLFFDASGIDTIDFLKGSVGSVNGGETSTLGPYGLGGTVDIRSLRPFDESRTKVSLKAQFGGITQYRATSDVNAPFAEHFGGLRIVTALSLFEPFYLPEGIDRGKSLFVAPSVSWSATDVLTFHFDTTVQLLEGPSYQGIPFVQGRFLTSTDMYYGDNDSRQDYIGLTLQYSGEWQVGDKSLVKFGLSYLRCDLTRTAWSISTVKSGMTSLAYYDSVVATGMAPLSYSYMDTTSQNYFANLYYIQDVDWGATAHKFVLGTDWLKQVSHMFSKSGTTADVDIYNPVFSLPATINSMTSDSQVDRNGFLLQDQMKWNSLLVLAGVRFDIHKSSKGNEGRSWSPRLGVAYLISDSWSFYGNYSQTEAPCFGYNDASGNEITDSWKGAQYEIGVKKDLFKGVLMSVSGFKIKQENTPVGVSGSPGVYELQGETESTGAELAFSGKVTNDWLVFLSYTFTYYDNKNAAKRFDSDPPHSVSLWQTYQFSSGPVKGLKLGLGARYAASCYSTQQGQYIGDAYVVPSFVVVDFSASYPIYTNRAKQRELLLKLDVKNLLDKEYVESKRHAGDTFPGAPRSFSISLSYEF